MMDRGESVEPAGFGMCDSCGNPLTERELFHGEVCESCIARDAADLWEGEQGE